jgi:hypothetical protein
MYSDHHVWDQIYNICLTYTDTTPAIKTTDIKKKAARYLAMDQKSKITKSDQRRICAKAKKIKKHSEKMLKLQEQLMAKKVIQVYNG